MALSRQVQTGLSALLAAILDREHELKTDLDSEARVTLADAVASMVCADPVLIWNEHQNVVFNADYIKLFVSESYRMFNIQIGSVDLELTLDPTRAASDERLSWMAYILLRFVIRPISSQRLANRITRIAHHHSYELSDVQKVIRLLSVISTPEVDVPLNTRADRWAKLCKGLSQQKTTLTELTYQKFSKLSQLRNVAALYQFLAAGGHEGCLSRTEYEDLEPILFATPTGANGLYISTLHILKERIDDGSVFSDHDIPADSL